MTVLVRRTRWSDPKARATSLAKKLWRGFTASSRRLRRRRCCGLTAPSSRHLASRATPTPTVLWQARQTLSPMLCAILGPTTRCPTSDPPQQRQRARQQAEKVGREEAALESSSRLRANGGVRHRTATTTTTRPRRRRPKGRRRWPQRSRRSEPGRGPPSDEGELTWLPSDSTSMRGVDRFVDVLEVGRLGALVGALLAAAAAGRDRCSRSVPTSSLR
mmetsp:Transcript_140015/g.447805  ORF Transcript_140015/g.447805 Transcript_140015/m.447805 type:complete len:218 (-) Transcript_140015:45-698(-)